MDRKLLYVFSLIGFFLMWGVFGFVAASSRSEPALRATLVPVESTKMNAEIIDPAVPITGEQPASAITVLYVLLGFGILIAVLALLNAANRPATTSISHKDPPDQS
ncbi:MAG TPA: hypothetical protein VK897_12075 [Anaerolineales bacterium]|nr:hypothetical protein [Anaerolineales bacterium]